MRRIGALGLSTVIAVLSVTVLMWIVQAAPPVAGSGQGSPDLAADVAVVAGEAPPAYGTNVWWTDQDAAVWTARWAELSPSHVRLFVSHALLESENDDADPATVNWDGFGFERPITVSWDMTRTYTYRAWFEALRDQPDLKIVIHFVYLAPWLSDNTPHLGIGAPYPPNDLAEYREFVEVVLRYLVETLGFPPGRITIEAMNEPDLGCGVDPVTFCFWDNWTMTDIVDVVRVTHEAIQAVDSEITLLGLAECCGTAVVRDLLDHYPEGDYLEGLSYHYYSPSGYDLAEALDRAAALAPYGRAIYFDEYGSRQYLSEGIDGGLWHSWALPTLWEAGVAPIQYPISEWPTLGEPYNSMGLFHDWRGDWERKPSYWVYANFFRFATGDVISHTAPASLDSLVTHQLVGDEVRVAFWVVHRGDVPLTDQVFAVYNFPEQEATLHVYDNLVGPTSLLTATIEGAPLVFTATLPARSSRTFVLSATRSPGTVDHVVLEPGAATRGAGQVISYTLTAYDAQGASWDVTASGTYTVDPGAGGAWLSNVYTTEVAGTWTVTGTYSDALDTAVLQVDPASLHRVTIVPTETRRIAGRSVTYTLTAYDAYDNGWDVTALGAYTIERGAGGAWNGNIYTTEISGTWTVTGALTSSAESDQATLTVWTPQAHLYLPLVLRGGGSS